MKRQHALVRLQNVSFAYQQRMILEDISLQLQPGEIVTLIGPNGAGKTTLVKLVLGLLKPTSGVVIRAPLIKIGYMPQKLTIDQTLPLTVLRFLKLTGSNTFTVKGILDRLRIRYLINTPVQEVSGGELQRVLLARAMLRKPDLLVLDEPAQGVDVTGQSELYQLIHTLKDEFGCAILMISHDLHLVMAATDQVICLNQHICCSGHPDQISEDPTFKALFGATSADTLAVYHHHHDHEHGVHGEIITSGKSP